MPSSIAMIQNMASLDPSKAHVDLPYNRAQRHVQYYAGTASWIPLGFSSFFAEFLCLHFWLRFVALRSFSPQLHAAVGGLWTCSITWNLFMRWINVGWFRTFSSSHKNNVVRDFMLILNTRFLRYYSTDDSCIINSQQPTLIVVFKF